MPVQSSSAIALPYFKQVNLLPLLLIICTCFHYCFILELEADGLLKTGRMTNVIKQIFAKKITCIVVLLAFSLQFTVHAFESGHVLFEDALSGSTLSSSWRAVSAGDAFQTPVMNNGLLLDATTRCDVADLILSDFILESEIMITDTDREYAGFVLRGAVGSREGYVVNFNIQANRIQILDFNSQQEQVGVSFAITPNTWYQVKTVVQGQRIEVFVGGESVLVYNGAALHTTGLVGVFSIWCKVHFKNFRISFMPVNAPPVITDEMITGHSVVGNTLAVSYEMPISTPSNEGTDVSIYEWYSIDDGSDMSWNGVGSSPSGWGAPVKSGTGKDYKPQNGDEGKYIAVVIYPKNTASAVNGAPIVLVTPDKVAAVATPVITNLSISGEVIAGQSLTGSYTYENHSGFAEGATEYRWLYTDSDDAEFLNLQPIPGAFGTTVPGASTPDGKGTVTGAGTVPAYRISNDYISGMIILEVTPVADGAPNGYIRGASAAEYTIAAMPPTANNVRITALKPLQRIAEGDVLTAQYDYYSANRIEKDALATVYTWQRSEDDGTWTTIETNTGENNNTYTLTALDTESSIRVLVKPTAIDGSEKDNAVSVSSPAVLLPHKPIVKNVAITGVGALNNKLTGTYEFEQANGNADLSTYRWFRNGAVIANQSGIDYYISEADLGTNITFEVTPKTDVKPEAGTPVTSAARAVPSASSGGSRGGGGGGGGMSGSTFTTPVAEVAVYDASAVNHAEQAGAFADTAGHWANDSLTRAVEIGIILGDDSGNFRPEDSITRAEFVAIVLRTLGASLVEYSGGFEDIHENDWYASAVASGVSEGLVQGSGGLFRPLDTITREEMAIIIVKAYQAKDGDMPNGGVDNAVFDDYNDISGWAVEFVEAAYSLGFVKGISENSFGPKANATRAEAGVINLRLFDKAAEGGV